MKLFTSVASAFVALTMAYAPAQADDLQAIKDAGKMSVALSGAYPPFSFVDENNQVVGFDVDIGSELARRLGVTPEVITTAWDGIIAGLVAGRYDTIVGSMGITPERQQAVDFVGPYYRSGVAIFVAEGSAFQTLADLDGKTVGANLGEVGEQWASARGEWTVHTYKALPDLLLELRSGRVDAIVTDDIPVLVAIKDNAEPVRQMDVPDLPKFDIGIALRKDSPELHAALQKALDDMMADGTYLKIAEKWIGTDIR